MKSYTSTPEPTERSLYDIITNVFIEVAKQKGINIKSISEPAVRAGPRPRYPDIFLQIDSHRILIQVKIDSVRKLIDDVISTYNIARQINADIIGILFPSEIRQIRALILKEIGPKIRIARSLVLTCFLSKSFEKITLQELAENVLESFLKYKETLKPETDYLTVARIARETIEELATALRRHMGVTYLDISRAIIGRFDIYRSLLEDFLREEEIKEYIADIMAYLLVIQLLFAHVVSWKMYGQSVLPRIDDPFQPPVNLLEKIANKIQESSLIQKYGNIIGSMPYVLKIINTIATNEPRINAVIARYIYTLHALRPENVKEELFGRIYQEGLPPQTRKNLGAFFTRPEAAKILANLAIEDWRDKVLDPACGSGTLLTEAYWAKVRLAPRKISPAVLHKIFLEEDIIGIDIMQFARELTLINLALQNPIVSVSPRIFVGDGIEKMFFAKELDAEDDPPTFPLGTIEDYLERTRREYQALILPREGLDLVIMNPPFTRRERIPERERNKLKRILGDIVRGRVGYWAYFLVAADNVIKPGGRLATVTPEEFFVGGAAEAIRRYLFFGEIYDKKQRTYKRILDRSYIPAYIVRSSVELAFSEGALYRDYLMILQKTTNEKEDPAILIILKKRLDEIGKEIKNIVDQIKSFKSSNLTEIDSEVFYALKLYRIKELLRKHIENLKPLVGLNCSQTQRKLWYLLEIFAEIGAPTLGELEEKGEIELLEYYSPGIFEEEKIEGIARMLFATRYGARGKCIFQIRSVTNDYVELDLRLKGVQGYTVKIPLHATFPALRTYSGVVHMNIVGEEEYAIIEPHVLPEALIKNLGFSFLELEKAANGIKEGIRRGIFGNLLLCRRVQLTTLYWLAYYSNKIVATTGVLFGVNVPDDIQRRILCLYLNSSVTLLQLLGFVVETRGAWVNLHGKRVWSQIHVPDVHKIPSDIRKEALELFEKIGKKEVVPFYRRILNRDPIQREIDKMALRLLGIKKLIPQLDEIYNAISCELNVMQRILEETRERKKKRKVSRKKKEEAKQTTLKMFIE